MEGTQDAHDGTGPGTGSVCDITFNPLGEGPKTSKPLGFSTSGHREWVEGSHAWLVGPLDSFLRSAVVKPLGSGKYGVDY